MFLDCVNTSTETNIFPETEKLAVVKPIVKGKVDPQCLSSYRPVTNLTFLSNIIENVILNQLLEHLHASCTYKPFLIISLSISECIRHKQLCVQW